MFSIKPLGLTRYLFQIIVLLLPTQLSYHFWPTYAFVNGVRVDYLSPTIYFTDILIFLFILLSLLQINVRKEIKKLILIHNSIFLILVLFIILNIFFAYSPALATVKWSKIIFFSFFAVTVILNKKLIVKKLFPIPYFISVVLVVVIQILQFTNGRSIGGVLYYLGERTFDTNTIGIALVNIFGKNYLRPYSIFPHPNALGGYLLVGTLLLLGFKKYIKKEVLHTTVLLSFIGILLSFSQTVWFAALALIIIYFFNLKKLKAIPFTIIMLSFLQLVLPYFDLSWWLNQENIIKRIELLGIAGKILEDNFISGIGLNNFIPLITVYTSVKSFWWLQPVHNFIVLYLVEAGIIGLIAIYFLYTKITQNFDFSKINTFFKLAVIGVFLTGFADHYWLTLQQNTLLFILLISIILKKSLYVEKMINPSTKV